MSEVERRPACEPPDGRAPLLGLGDVYARVRGRGRVTTSTHSRRRLVRLLREAQLDARIALVFPSYGQPQLVFDEEVFRPASDFYLKHVLPYSSPARRCRRDGGALSSSGGRLDGWVERPPLAYLSDPRERAEAT
jgi:hypothetical protein